MKTDLRLIAEITRCRRHVVLCYELLPDIAVSDQEKLVAELKVITLAHPHTACIETFLRHPAFPVDIRHNAKIGREKLALWATEKFKGAV